MLTYWKAVSIYKVAHGADNSTAPQPWRLRNGEGFIINAPCDNQPQTLWGRHLLYSNTVLLPNSVFEPLFLPACSEKVHFLDSRSSHTGEGFQSPVLITGVPLFPHLQRTPASPPGKHLHLGQGSCVGILTAEDILRDHQQILVNPFFSKLRLSLIFTNVERLPCFPQNRESCWIRPLKKKAKTKT